MSETIYTHFPYIYEQSTGHWISTAWEDKRRLRGKLAKLLCKAALLLLLGWFCCALLLCL